MPVPYQIKNLPSDCFNWPYQHNTEYPKIKVKDKIWPVHRWVFAVTYPKEFKEELFVCHHCDNPRCVNIKHLYQGTAKQNSIDQYEHGARSRPSEVVRWEKGKKQKCFMTKEKKKKKKKRIKKSLNIPMIGKSLVLVLPKKSDVPVEVPEGIKRLIELMQSR